MSDSEDLDILRSMLSVSTEPIIVDILRRELWLGDIDSNVSREAIRHIKNLLQISKQEVRIIVNSSGGTVSDGLAIADFMRWQSSQGFIISTHVYGEAYSAGALVSASGTIGHRYALPSSRFLIHQLSVSGLDGKFEAVESDVRNLKALNLQMIQILMDVTGKSKQVISKDFKKETFMSAEQAISYGLLDHILGKENG